ncbi:MAG TPA: hypothetical protein VEJ18_16455, partial [Planctomycetota bacterium]|nr:hypothetical protein [Planctomycetota bacterium]
IREGNLMGNSPAVQSLRHRFIIEDPGRFACLCAIAALTFMPRVPFSLTLLATAVTQLVAVAIVWRGQRPGWSLEGGRRVKETVFASSLAMDLSALSASTIVGALLLARLFENTDSVVPLGVLGVAVCFLPDVRLCRILMAGDPVTASAQLRDGWQFRDPSAWGAMLTGAAACLVDAGSLHLAALSLLILHASSILVILDKYIPEVLGAEGLWRRMATSRDGRRLLLALAAVALVPIRELAGDPWAWRVLATMAALVVAADLWRLAGLGLRWVTGLFRVTPSHNTYVVLGPRN